MILKICGLKNSENIRQVADESPDFMGFIFYDKSPRFVDDEKLATILKKIPSAIIKTGVFVNEVPLKIEEIISTYGLGAIQLHGSETPELCNGFQDKGLKVIKAFGIREASDFDQIEKYDGSCDYFLFDTKTKIHGGSGKSFNWDLLKFYTGKTPFLLSGGIGIADIDEIQKIVHPQLSGIDVNSGFEIEPGLKDIELIKKLISALSPKSHFLPPT
ncbi:MAG: phosphoribosylanthranilate isomerase [Bacteroidales bacterium]|jgi:phosphoribosylanthranilate isomerase|nr:phosphoribosylanthranilate isomerase [Bacteroidales bacterium]